MKTRTGGFPIGWRRRNYAWEQDLDGMIAWAKANDLEVIDVGKDGETSAKKVLDAGLQVGSADLPHWGRGLTTADKGQRAEAVARNSEYIRNVAALGVHNFFTDPAPDDESRPRSESFALLVESFQALVPALESSSSHVVIEPYPGHNGLACTPETFAALFEQIPSSAIGINYDPSHMIRQGIDPLRFLREFVDRVFHVHAKDCRIIAENVYRYGYELPAVFDQKMPYGQFAWRYAIPSHGLTDWIEVCTILHDAGYQGALSIELEDKNFDDTESSKLGILQAATFLSAC